MEIVLLELRYKQVTLLEKQCFLRTSILKYVNKCSCQFVLLALI
jgi:hypothetical protein